MTKESFQMFGIIGLVGLVIFAAVEWEKYKWHECRKVGHGFWYCVWHQGK